MNVEREERLSSKEMTTARKIWYIAQSVLLTSMKRRILTMKNDLVLSKQSRRGIA